MKWRCIAERGLLRERQQFTNYANDLARHDWINGWHYPFIPEEHMDDPRSPDTMLRTDDDLRRRNPLSAWIRHVVTCAPGKRKSREGCPACTSPAALNRRH